MQSKTNAIRLLESQNISFEWQSYAVDENDLSAVHVAESLGILPERIFKTLVVTNESNEFFVAVIPGNYQLNVKKMAQLTQSKSCAMLPSKDLLKVTGYQRGGCSPIGMKKSFPTFIEESAQLFPSIYVSGGQRGIQILLSPEDLKQLTQAEFADLLK